MNKILIPALLAFVTLLLTSCSDPAYDPTEKTVVGTVIHNGPMEDTRAFHTSRSLVVLVDGILIVRGGQIYKDEVLDFDTPVGTRMLVRYKEYPNGDKNGFIIMGKAPPDKQ